MKSGQEKKNLFYKSYETPSLGCLGCPEHELCGGNNSSPGFYDCTVFCQCEDTSECTNVCPNSDNYIARIQEIKGFKLDNIPRSKPLTYSELPLVAPLIYHRSKRDTNIEIQAVSIPLRCLISRSDGKLKYTTKKEIANHFRFNENAKLIIVGADGDKYIEDYWSNRSIADLPNKLAALKPDLVTTPNYSLPLGVVRMDNMYNIKRIAIAWSELVTSGVPAALHVNARTDKDWERWTEFIIKRDEIHSICFEFGTGGLSDERSQYYVTNLEKLAKNVGRDLRLVIRGGQNYVMPLKAAYSKLVFVDSTSFMKSVFRRALNWKPGDTMTDRVRKTAVGESIDHLLAQNIEIMAEMIRFNTLTQPNVKSPLQTRAVR